MEGQDSVEYAARQDGYVQSARMRLLLLNIMVWKGMEWKGKVGRANQDEAGSESECV